VLSYSTYGATFQSTIAGNLVRLLACRSDVRRYVRHAVAEEVMLRHYAASTAALLGHVAHWRGAEDGALVEYVQAARLLPDDLALRRLAGATYFKLQGR
jgi:hypothetical protein